ncbi:MAG: winged helix-turn-helix domain-containing protein, partial [Candidatus Dormibacteraceae bacterium]
PQTMRALAHPVRIALLEELSVWGPLTATEAGERIGESATTCSFHLRQLAHYGFVEEAGGGKGRARPWRMASIGMHMNPVQTDPEVAVAADAVTRLVRDRQLARYAAWLDTQHGYPTAWREAGDSTELLFWLTPEELKDLIGEVHQVLERRLDERLTDPSQRPPGALPVELLLFAYPMRPPARA